MRSSAKIILIFLFVAALAFVISQVRVEKFVDNRPRDEDGNCVEDGWFRYPCNWNITKWQQKNAARRGREMNMTYFEYIGSFFN
jgi:hypothetical protein